jgi:hypothetical protein
MAYVWVDDPNDNDDDDDFGDTSNQRPAKQLPAPARKHMRDLEKKNKELEDKLTELAKAQRKVTVSEKVEAKGYDPMVAGLVPPDCEDVDKWLDDHSAVLAKKTADAGGKVQGAEDDAGNDPELAKALGQIQAATSSGSVVPTRESDLASLIRAAKTPEDMEALIKTFGKVPIKDD